MTLLLVLLRPVARRAGAGELSEGLVIDTSLAVMTLEALVPYWRAVGREGSALGP